MRTQVIFEKDKKLIKIANTVCDDDDKSSASSDLDSLQVSCNFGASLLYEYAGYNFHPRAVHVLANIDEIKYRSDDVLLTMFPKSGSTWLSELIFLITNNYKYKLASEDSIEYRFPQIDSPSHDVFDLILENYNNPNAQRLIKASIPPNLMIEHPNQSINSQATKPLVISIFRDPRDVLVSFYHHCKTVKHYDVDFSFDDFFDWFIDGKVPCGPIWKMYNETLDYHHRNPDTTLSVFYENMKSNLRHEIKRICAFLRKPEPETEEDWLMLLDHLSVEKMRLNKTINRHDWTKMGLRNENGYEFVRRGQTKDWKNFFNDRQTQEAKSMIDKMDLMLQKMYN